MDPKSSFTAALGGIPVKMLSPSIIARIMEGKMFPIHPQVYLTNKCNLNCKDCATGNRNHSDEIDFDQLMSFIARYPTIKAVTITGGGEPLLHPRFADVIRAFHTQKVLSGVITNGIKISQFEDVLSFIDWVRISLYSNNIDKILSQKECLRKHSDRIGYNVVCLDVTGTVDLLCRFIDAGIKFTHIKISDNAYGDTSLSQLVYSEIIAMYPSLTDRIFTSPYAEWEYPTVPCQIWKLKPLLSAAGGIYPCCGLHYQDKTSRDLPAEYKIGDLQNLDKFDRNLKEGKISIPKCSNCPYISYNEFIHMCQHAYQNKEFI